MMQATPIKLRAGDYMVPATLILDEHFYFLKFGYNKKLLAEVKAMAGAKWHPDQKLWSFDRSQRNDFQLAYLRGENPYAPYDLEIKHYEYNRPLREHQVEMADFTMARKKCILAAEMGTGKTLVFIEVMEKSGFEDWWYVGPKSALMSVERELKKWRCRIRPEMLTYEMLTRRMREWNDGDVAPHGVAFDESSRTKNPTAQRSQAALALANGVRDDWGQDGFVILMSGSPAPRSPVDWWSQCEIACPGFLKEGNVEKFKRRLGIITERESVAGGMYPHLESWLDDERKCAKCGKYQDDIVHDAEGCIIDALAYHPFQPSTNEVSYLYQRMAGLVLVKFKKDCLDLPDKQYRVIEFTPSRKTLNLAKLVIAKSSTAVGALTLLRELSDGFQYQELEDGTETCPVCGGKGKIANPLAANREQWSQHEADGGCVPEDVRDSLENTDAETVCDGCGGHGTRKRYKRVAQQIETPKEQALIDLLDEHSEIGRLVVYAGFSGSIDRVKQIVKSQGWEYVKMDGRGIETSVAGDPIEIFQDKLEEYPRVAFIGHPASAGMGLTLTASPTTVYYSNDFNFESRTQSEDRIHRIGMDANRGATIIDFIHLPSDQLVLDNLKKKKKLQALTLGDVSTALESGVQNDSD